MKQVTAVVLGAGGRGRAYAQYALDFPNELNIVAVAEPDETRRRTFAEMHGIADDRRFDDWEALLSRPRMADAVLICTQDRMHYEPSLRALEQSVQAVPIPGSGGNGLQAVDNHFSTADQYATSPVLRRTIANFGGKVTVETKMMFSKIDHEVGNYFMELIGNGRVFGALVGFSDGGFGYQQSINGAVTNMRLTEYGVFAQPQDQWVSLRFEIDFEAKQYDLIMQADKLKNYTGALAANGTLDRTTGVYRVENIPFLDGSAQVRGFEMFRFYSQRFTGKYTFDFLAAYPTAQPDVTAPTTTDDAPASGMSNTDVTVNLAATDDRSGVAYTKYSINGGEPATGNSVVLTTEGIHAITYWSEDAAGNVETQRSVTVTIDKTAPTTVAATVSEDVYGGEWYRSPVTVRFSAPDALAGVSRTEYRMNDGEWIVYDGAIPSLDEGVYTVEYRSIDAAGNVEPAKTLVVRVDVTAPELTVALDRTAIWPPNNKMVDIHATIASSDETSGVASVLLTSIASNEPDDGDIEAELGAPTDFFRLRAERSGGGADRVYTITYTVTDHAGNRSTATATVTVPHNQ